MNKLFVVFLLLVSINNANGQDFETIVDSTKQWSVVKECYDNWNGNGMVSATTFGYRFRGKKIVNNFYYSYLEFCKDPNFEGWEKTPYLFRTDSANGDFIYKDGIEHLLYNYNVKVGDTVWVPDYISFNHVSEDIVEGVSNSFFAGKLRKAISLKYRDDLNYYQGFGTKRGILGFTYDWMSDCRLRLSCFHHNGSLLYQDGNCYVNFNKTSIQDTSIKEILIYPNPVKDELFVNNVKEILKYSIININGEVVNRGKFENMDNIIKFPYINGIYILEVKDIDDNTVLTKKIIK